jgi:thiol-disulfide isomerase/thioredoxin
MPSFASPLPPALVLAFLLPLVADPGARGADPAPSPRPSSRSPVVPAVPDGSPAELLAYIESLADPAALPTSRGRLRYYLRKAAEATADAAGRILAQTRPEDPLHDRAIALKLDALQTMQRLGEPQAAEALAAFAASLGEVEDEALAARVRRAAVAAQIEAAIASGRPEDAAPLVARVAAAVKAAPDDEDLAKAAAGLAAKLAEMPGGEPAAAGAFETLLPLFEASGSQAVRDLAAELGGTARRLSLPGRPMKITGTLLSGEAFDQGTLAGKVVLVDFWATWCGPCVAEIANLRKEYDRWHAQGFEVVGVSLDEDRDTLERFVTAKKIPWPVLYEEPGGPGWRHPLASYYGITGIPTVVLIGADGNVITLDARGKKLGVALERLLGEPPARIGDRRPRSPVTP